MKKIIFAVLIPVIFTALLVYAQQPDINADTTSKALAITQPPPKYKPKPPPPKPEKKWIESFKKYSAGKFPTSWRTWPFQRGKAGNVYTVMEEDGKKYLRAKESFGASAQIMLPFIWPVEEMPYLNWRWRPMLLPKGAKESADNLNDSACGVYVIFGRYTGVASKYVWSTTLPVEQVVSRREGKLRIKVVGSGPEGLGKWYGYSVNVPEDYRKMFGKSMDREPTGIAILTDGNATSTPAECDYDDFVISKKPLY